VGTRPHSRLAHPITGHPSFKGRSSRRYAFLARGLLRGVYRRIGEDMALTAPPSGAVLDVGTGPGVLLAEIAAQRPGLQVTGIDPSTDMVTAANRTISKYGERVTARVGDVTNLDFPDASFDLIITTFSMHHWDDVPAAVPELARVLRPGGALYVYDLPHVTLRHARRGGPDQLPAHGAAGPTQRHPHRPSTHPPMHPPRPDHRHHPR
jgi:ubiquinone/menaquinone biosynthesis C-methylase UbiE